MNKTNTLIQTNNSLIKMSEIVLDNIFVTVKMCFPKTNRHSNGKNLCPFTSWLDPLFICDGIYTGVSQEELQKIALF